LNETAIYRELPSEVPGIACLWVHVVGPAPTRVLPDACADLIWRAGHGVFLAGPDTRATPTELPAGTVMVGARFAPGAGGPALGFPLTEVRDRRAGPEELGFDLPGDLAPGEALQAMARRVATLSGPDEAVREAARRLADPQQRLSTLAADLGLSERQLRRRCLDAAGYAPKLLQRVLRFRRFVAAAEAQGPPADLARLAAQAGYADQSHLTRECAELSGLPPAALLRARSSSTGPAAGRTTGR
jgi:AraC-like DNA-binding protein